MDTNFYYEMIKMVSALAAVLGIMYLMFYAARKTIWKGMIPADQKVSIRVLGQRSLGQKKDIAVVEVDGQRLVLGITAQTINLLGHVDGFTEPELETVDQTQQPVTHIFSRMMAAFDRRESGATGK